MRYVLAISMAILLGAGCASKPALVASHSPNPCDVHVSKAFPKNPLPFMWYYRTEVRNNTSRPIQITAFECFFLIEGEWVPRNIFGRKLNSEDLSRWYAEGAPVTNGWIQPGQVAACDPNWHGFTTNASPSCKWIFEGQDDNGNSYRAEAEIQSVTIKP